MKPQTLFHRNFTLMIIGQIISLFGNSILRFALSLFVLDVTGSAAVFGGILALSMIPTVVCAPLGGVLADRVPRQHIMAALDFAAAGLVAILAVVLRTQASILAIGVLLIGLSIIQAFYQPSVQSSIPALTADQHLMAANGVVMQVQYLATLLGPVIGGILYAWVGLLPMMVVSALCFLASAVMELFLRIPFTPQPRTASTLGQIRADLGEALHFLRRDNPILFRVLFLVAGLNLFLSALFLVGLPYLVKITLALSAQHYGFAEATLSLGAILGGLLSGVLAQRVGIRHSYLFLAATALLLLPMALALLLGLPAPVCYGIILACVLLGMAAASLFSIICQTFLQQQTPGHLLGKIAALVSAISVCAMPLGQAMYGVLFEVFRASTWLVVLLGAVSSLILALLAGRTLRGIVPAADAPVDDSPAKEVY